MLLPQKRMPAYFLFLTLGAFITLTILLASPSDPKNAVWLGYSLERILLAAGIFLPGLALLFLTVKLFRQPEHSLRLWASLTGYSRFASIFSLLLFFFFWILIFMPSYRLGGMAGYIERLYPILGWLAIVGAATSAMLLIQRKNMRTDSTGADKTILKIASVCATVFILLGLFVGITGLGIRFPADYWYGAGVPILGLQVLFSLFAAATTLVLDAKLKAFNQKRLDAVLFIAIWIVAAWFWAREPLSPNYFMPDTAKNVIYPYSDGMTFDGGAQYALIGQGISNGLFFERVLYSVLLVYLHMLLGQDFTILMTAQAALFAVLPALIYLIGRELHSRALGISAGVLLALRGVNAIIAARWIDTASPKMMLTDFPTAIGIAVFLLLLIKWLKQPARIGALVWAGAAFTLTFMVRSNVLTLLPAVFLAIPFLIKLRWRQVLLAGLLVLLGLFAVSLPWEIRNQSRGIPMYSMYYTRILTVLQYRYGIGGEVPLLAQDESPARFENSASVRGARMRVLRADEPACDSTLCHIGNHFLHNLVTSFVSLPSSPVLDDLWNTVKADTPYWKKAWSEGRMDTLGVAVMVLNLGLLSLGAGSLWDRARALALLPPLVFATYLFTNSLSMTSGGRYIAPVDWIVYLYFMAGGLQLVVWFLKAADFEFESTDSPNHPPSFPVIDKRAVMNGFPALLSIFALGALLPVSEMFFPQRYQVRPAQEILSNLEQAGFLEQTGYTRQELTDFLSQPGAMIREGRALYPRYYPSGEGEPDRSTYYRALDYQRLVFTLIGPYSSANEGVVIPGFAPPLSFHAEDMVVLGCWDTTYYAPFIDAVAVVVTSGEGYVYNRAPESPLQCPLQVP